MPPLDIRTNFIVGLVVLLVVWFVVVIITKLALGWSYNRASRYENDEALKGIRHTKEWVNSLLIPSLCVIILLWAAALRSL